MAKAIKKSKKLDPHKLFTVMTVDRATIADSLNMAIQINGSEVPEFEQDDPRLTDKVCQGIANSLYDAYTNAADDAMDEAEHEMYIEAIDQFE